MAQQNWTTWNASWIWSLILIAITIATHLAGIGLIVNVAERLRTRLRTRLLQSTGSYLRIMPVTAAMVGVALTLAVLHGIESMIWAVAYVQLGALSSPADAALYSVDSMTTRGASGLVLEREWRMMGAVEAGDGMLLFGISTAFLFFMMGRLWKTESDLRI
jgi:hypothetical protein